jgi:hypothetical protein
MSRWGCLPWGWPRPGIWVVAPGAAAAVIISRHPGWPGIALRAAGSWIAAIGIMMLGLALG